MNTSYGARAEHLRPTNDDAVVTLGGGAAVEVRLGLLVRRFGAVDGGMDDDVADVEVLVGSLGSEVHQVVGKLLPAPRVKRRRAREACEKRCDMIRRAP